MGRGGKGGQEVIIGPVNQAFGIQLQVLQVEERFQNSSEMVHKIYYGVFDDIEYILLNNRYHLKIQI